MTKSERYPIALAMWDDVCSITQGRLGGQDSF